MPDVFTLRAKDIIFIIEIELRHTNERLARSTRSLQVQGTALSVSRKRVRMVVDDQLTQAVNRVADAIEENTSVIKQILGHYNAVVPSMKENADRANKFGRDAEAIAEAEEMRLNGQHN